MVGLTMVNNKGKQPTIINHLLVVVVLLVSHQLGWALQALLSAGFQHVPSIARRFPSLQFDHWNPWSIFFPHQFWSLEFLWKKNRVLSDVCYCWSWHSVLPSMTGRRFAASGALHVQMKLLRSARTIWVCPKLLVSLSVIVIIGWLVATTIFGQPHILIGCPTIPGKCTPNRLYERHCQSVL